MGNYERMFVKINQGSGVIVKSSDANFDYVFTAKHVLKAVKTITDIKVSKVEQQFDVLEMPIYFEDVDIDIAIIKIKKIKDFDDIPLVLTVLEKNSKHYELEMFGFPNCEGNINTSEMELESLKIESLEVKSDFHKIKFNSEGYIDLDGYTHGYSGSGIFKKENEKVYLYGLFFKLKTERHYGQAVKSSTILKLLKSKELPLPENTEMEFLNDILGITGNLKATLLTLSRNKRQNNLDILNHVEEYLTDDTEKTKAKYFEFFPDHTKINLENLKTFVVFLFFTQLVETKIEIDNKTLAVQINNNNNWLFKSLNFEMGMSIMVGELADFLYRYYKNKNGILHIYDFVNKDNPAFSCLECEVLSKLKDLENINVDLFKIKKNNDFLELEEEYSALDLKCGDCFKINNLEKGKEKIKIYNLI